MDINNEKEFKNELRNYRRFEGKYLNLKNQIDGYRTALEGIKSASPLLDKDKGTAKDPTAKYTEILAKIDEIENSEDYLYYKTYFQRMNTLLLKLNEFDRLMFMDLYTSDKPHTWRYWHRKSKEEGTTEAFYKRKMTIIRNLQKR